MKYLEKDLTNIDVPTKRIVFFGDIHWGTKACAEDLVKETVKEIKKDPTLRWIGMGDALDCIGFRDKRFDPRTLPDRYDIADLDDLFMLQIQEFVDIVDPIRHQCIGLLNGNHEDMIRRFHNLNIYHHLCKTILPDGIAFNDFCLEDMTMMAIKYREGKKPIILWATHGSGGAAKTSETALRRVKAWMNQFIADAYAMGHVHWAVADNNVVAIDQKGKEVRKAIAITGGFLKAYLRDVSTYVERRIYPPIPLSAMVMSIEENGRLRFTEFP